ncbi:MAG TPA: HD domain-containing protein [Patescibacteria group bacterium]
MSPMQLLTFYRLAEKLKTTLRHSWLNDGQRQESVAEHSWMMCLLAMVLAPKMKTPLNLEKVLKMCVIHDLAEAVTQDLPVWQGIKNKKEKLKAERVAIIKIFKQLDSETSQGCLSLWEEYEERKSPEALFVKAIDTLDVIAQHNVAPLETWDKNDYHWQLSSLQDAFFDIDPLLEKIKDEIDRWTNEKTKDSQKENND